MGRSLFTGIYEIVAFKDKVFNIPPRREIINQVTYFGWYFSCELIGR